MHANTPRRVVQRYACFLFRCTTHSPSLIFFHLILLIFFARLFRLNQNYISATTIRDIGVLRNDLLSALTSAGLIQVAQRASAPELNAHAGEPALLKALLLAALYPSVAHIALPPNAIKYSRVASGTVAKEAGAHEWRATDMRGKRVWVHPASMLFTETRWRSGIVVSFERVETANKNNKNGNNKVYLRDVTEVSQSGVALIRPR
jgi:ATP-dependent RNA helicase DHX57